MHSHIPVGRLTELENPDDDEDDDDEDAYDVEALLAEPMLHLASVTSRAIDTFVDIRVTVLVEQRPDEVHSGRDNDHGVHGNRVRVYRYEAFDTANGADKAASYGSIRPVLNRRRNGLTPRQKPMPSKYTSR